MPTEIDRFIQYKHREEAGEKGGEMKFKCDVE